MVVEPRMEYCGKLFKDSFETYTTFQWRIIIEFERKVNVKTIHLGGYVLRIDFL